MPDGYGLDDYAGLLWEGDRPTLCGDRAPRRPRLPRHELERAGVVESPAPGPLPARPQRPAALREDIAEFRRIKSMRKRAGWLG